MNINFTRLKGLILELRLIRGELSRIADLYELHLQHTEGLTTRQAPLAPSDSTSTSVHYSDPELDRFKQNFENRAGRAMTDEELTRLEALLQETEE